MLHLYIKGIMKMKKYQILIEVFLCLFILSCRTTNNNVSKSSQNWLYDTIKNQRIDYLKHHYVEMFQIEAMFSYKNETWEKYLVKHINQKVPKKNGAPKGIYAVMVSFLISKTGIIDDIKFIDAPKPDYGMCNEIIRVLQNSPQWLPASQNGRNVIYRQQQTIHFIVK
jgi:hypothetical protein